MAFADSRPRRGEAPAKSQHRQEARLKPYRGVNVFLLAFTAYAKGFDSAYWLSFKQALQRGGNVKKGEKAQIHAAGLKTLLYQDITFMREDATTVPCTRGTTFV